MDHAEKIRRLQKKMGKEPMKELDQIISSVLNKNPSIDKKELNKQYLLPKIRQHGLQVQVKKRLLRVIQFKKDDKLRMYSFNHHLKNDLFKLIGDKLKHRKPAFEVDDHHDEIIQYLYSRGSLRDLEHYSVWVDKQIYHWGPSDKWVMYGDSETNREITNEWDLDLECPSLSFTLRTHDEIKTFCENFKTNPFNIDEKNSKTFKNELVNFLDLDY
uniref:Uncharacterized protein n=1 Tax=viral metagenome TaxID=1070528 RepID=A0A6C0E9L5_9ZZZZ